MKKAFFLFALILSATALNASPAMERISIGKLSSVISEFRGAEGFEVFSLGRVGTVAIKSIVRLEALQDGGDGDLARLIGGIKKIAIVDFKECKQADKARFERKMGRLLNDDCLIMEAGDGKDKMKIYGVLDEKAERFDNFVLYVPSDCALVCFFGSIPLSTVSKALSQ